MGPVADTLIPLMASRQFPLAGALRSLIKLLETLTVVPVPRVIPLTSELVIADGFPFWARS